MKFQTGVELQDLNTLRLPAQAAYYVEVDAVEQMGAVREFIDQHSLGFFVLGGGSNTLFTTDYPGLVIKMNIKGKKIVSLDETSVILDIAAGEDWHELVEYSVDNGWGGIENLALIPGSVGAAPVQNIAAYGQNLSDVLVSVTGYEINNGQMITLKREDCEFAYRDSIFKNDLRDSVAITNVRLKLHRLPELETSYFSIGGLNDSLKNELQKNSKKPYTVKDVFDAVVAIRQRKLLDWHEYPTVGSFFINPIVSRETYETLRLLDPDLQAYPIEDLHYKSLDDPSLNQEEFVKIPVGRILDFLGWKGRSVGNCRVHDKVASIFSHNGQATGAEFFAFTEEIKADVRAKMGIELQSEVSFI